jgi:hypothetical protein
MPWFRCALQNFYCSVPVPALASFQCVTSDVDPQINIPAATHLYTKSSGYIHGELHDVEVWSAHSGLIIQVPGSRQFYIPEDSPLSIITSNEHTPLSDLETQVLLGPALLMGLALRGIWCLHASAILQEDKVLAFLGESGEGKSTLASYLDGEVKFRLVADDILPVASGTLIPVALPHYPQLKLPIKEQPSANLPERISFNRIYRLRRADPKTNFEISQLSQKEGLQALLACTAATRLFGPSLLKNHLDFCVEVVQQCPVFELISPHDQERLAEIASVL